MSRHALVNADGLVVNTIELDSTVSNYAPQAGFTVVEEKVYVFHIGGKIDVVTGVYTPPVLTLTTPEIISDRQFYQQLAVLGLISQDDALAAVKIGAVPATLKKLIDALPTDQQFAAEMHVAGAVEFRRDHPLTAALAVGMGWTSDQVDQLWIAAAQL
ncbi:MAG TPA: hypothetical protein VK148_29670 [Xanthobacteraceae bacterium]|jgi:hypothetical protein|nr:hypothetical protein [Xanthobacteraceae bacterium]